MRLGLPRPFWLVLGALVAATLAVGVVWFTTRGSTSDSPVHAAPHSYAQRVKNNYRVLSSSQTGKLLDFADSFASCMTHRGINIGRPRSLKTRIEMAVPALKPQRILGPMTKCGAALGDPPPGSSLILTGHTVQLYLPKQCLLDPKVVASAQHDAVSP